MLRILKMQVNKLFIAVALAGLLFASCSSDDEEDEVPEPLPYAEQLAIDVEIIDDYLTANGITAQVDSASGLRYVIHEAGTGKTPDLQNSILVRYEGRLLSNGDIFDSNMDSDGNSFFPLNGVIRGWQIGMPKISEGGSITLYVPSGLGYGPYERGSIPANGNLIFDVNLLEVL